MRGFLPAVSLLIGVILVSCEITLSDTTEVETEEPLVMGEIEERIDPNHETDATGDQRTEYLGHTEDRIDLDSDSRGASKTRENVDTWLDLAKSKELRNLPSSQRRRKKKKKTATTIPWIYQWGNKRRENVEGTGSGVRMFRLPFNSWGGKRGSMTFSPLQDNIYDRYGRFVSAEGNDVKKKAEDIERVRGKIRFNSWGGKRSEQPTDSRYITYLKERVYGTPVLRVYKVYESMKGKNNDDKENNFIHRIPNHLYNDTSQDDSSTDDGRPLVEKKRQHEICKRAVFNSWAGKRNYNSDTICLDKNLLFPAKLQTETVACCYLMN